MKKTIITGIAALFCSAALAQQAGVPEQSNEPVSESKYGDDMSFFDNIDEYAVYTSKAEIAAEQFLNEIGMNIGLNKSDKGDIYIARGFANFSVDASNKQFEIDRSLTFEAAMADAKKAIANYFGQEVSKKLQSVLEMNNPTAEPMSNTSQNKGANPDVFDKLVNLANAKLDEELAKSNKGGAASEETIKKVLNSSSMATAIERVSAQQVGGLITLKVFEEKDGISVIACYSDLSIELAAIINGNTANIKRSDVKGEPIIPAINKMEIGELYTCQGVQTKPD